MNNQVYMEQGNSNPMMITMTPDQLNSLVSGQIYQTNQLNQGYNVQMQPQPIQQYSQPMINTSNNIVNTSNRINNVIDNDTTKRKLIFATKSISNNVQSMTYKISDTIKFISEYVSKNAIYYDEVDRDIIFNIYNNVITLFNDARRIIFTLEKTRGKSESAINKKYEYLNEIDILINITKYSIYDFASFGFIDDETTNTIIGKISSIGGSIGGFKKKIELDNKKTESTDNSDNN